MKNDSKMILTIFLAAGTFIFIKGSQDNLGIIDILTIFVTFVGFVIGFTLLTASIINFISWISAIFFKKIKRKLKI